MFAKFESRNLVALPEEIVSAFRDTDYFRVKVEDGRIALTPTDYTTREILAVEGEVARQNFGRKMEELGITEDDVAEVVAEARRKRNREG